MISTVVMCLSLCFCVVTLFVVLKHQKPAASKRDQSLAQLEEVLRTAQLTNNGFFQSLEMVQKNLESLLARAESAEQRIRNLMLQPGGEKRDQYTAAALLLNEGHEPHRVASMLNLPLAQVEIVQQLHRMASKDKKPGQRKKRSEDEYAGRKNPLPTKIAARREKSSQPILLADLLKKAASDSTTSSAPQAPFAGIKA
jgi:hypothetical protein